MVQMRVSKQRSWNLYAEDELFYGFLQGRTQEVGNTRSDVFHASSGKVIWQDKVLRSASLVLYFSLNMRNTKEGGYRFYISNLFSSLSLVTIFYQNLFYLSIFTQ